MAKGIWKNGKKPIPPSNKGKKFSLEHRRKMSEAHLGAKHHLWKGGITPIVISIRNCFKYRQWRSDIFTRDDYTCSNCGSRGVRLEVHHIKSFSTIMEDYKIKTLDDGVNCEELWNINNGVTLCKECHNITTNFGRKSWKKI
jgi:hypothetical protein